MSIEKLMYENRICWEEKHPLEDFKYIGQQTSPDPEQMDDLYLYNCIKKDCKNYGSTINIDNIPEHIRKYHGDKK